MKQQEYRSHRRSIIAAGDSATRRHPITQASNKKLLTVYNKPTIDYPLTPLMLADIREVLIITNLHDQGAFKKLLGDNSN